MMYTNTIRRIDTDKIMNTDKDIFKFVDLG